MEIWEYVQDEEKVEEKIQHEIVELEIVEQSIDTSEVYLEIN